MTDILQVSVSQLTKLIKDTLVQNFYNIELTGEISNFKIASSGHWFFSLKDKGAMISAVLFRSSAWKVDFDPQEGDLVTVRGAIDLYEPRGSYQIVCSSMERAGNGDILLEIERRKQYFRNLGYFDEDKKKEIPLYPSRIGVVTSPTGAAIQDVLQILGRRAPALDVIVLPCAVQGDNAAREIAFRIAQADNLMLCDTLIVGRGGGSLEDLLAFSDPLVIEAIHSCSIPVISGVGHEIDWALSDYVADMRAPTPSAAAEIASRGIYDIRLKSQDAIRNLKSTISSRIESTQKIIDSTSMDTMRGFVENRIRYFELGCANASSSLELAMRSRIDTIQRTITHSSQMLEAFSPTKVLSRGYAIVRNDEGSIIRRTDDIHDGRLSIQLEDGTKEMEVRSL